VAENKFQDGATKKEVKDAADEAALAAGVDKEEANSLADEATGKAMDNGDQNILMKGLNSLLSTLEDLVGVLMRNMRFAQLLIIAGLLLVGLGAFAFTMRSRDARRQARTIVRCSPKDRSCCYKEVDPAEGPVNAAWYPKAIPGSTCCGDLGEGSPGAGARASCVWWWL
jgi:hypothetical protein